MINAVVHADYAQRGAPIRLSIFDDRLEVENPGLLPFGLTVEDLQRGISKLRNRVIGGVFHALGPTRLDETDQAILDALAGGKWRLTSEIAKAIGLPPRATRTRLAKLVGSGLVREIGTGPQDPRRHYFRAE